MVVLHFLSAALGKNDIVAFELAGSLPRARTIIDGWDGRQRLLAAFHLGLDYLFIFSYATAIGLGCLLAAPGWAPLGSIGTGLAWALVLAGLLDSIENWALLRVLLGSSAAGLPVLANLADWVKFVLAGLGLFHVAVGGIRRWRDI